jgi:Mg-chelatase subunit ChlD
VSSATGNADGTAPVPAVVVYPAPAPAPAPSGASRQGDPAALRRWRLVLGGGQADGVGWTLEGSDVGRDATLGALYDPGEEGTRRGRLSGSAPRVARWLGDIRTYFPTSVVQVMQRDAMTRLGLTQMLLEPELLDAVVPDIHLVGTLLSLRAAIPEHSRESARNLIRRVVDDLEARLAAPTRQALARALDRAATTRRPRSGEVDWDRTIAANLRHYQPELHTVIPEHLVGFARRGPRLSRHVVLCIDQSASMASSVIYASVFGAVMAGVRSLSTRLVAFDTSVVDLTEELHDPVDLLFGLQLGGGTDIASALSYCASRITSPTSTVLVLISDLFEGALREDLSARAAELVAAGVTVIALLALSDDGAPSFDRDNAAALAELGIAAFACTPDQFPGLMATAIEGGNIVAWASAEGIVRSQEDQAVGNPAP